MRSSDSSLKMVRFFAFKKNWLRLPPPNRLLANWSPRFGGCGVCRAVAKSKWRDHGRAVYGVYRGDDADARSTEKFIKFKHSDAVYVYLC